MQPCNEFTTKNCKQGDLILKDAKRGGDGAVEGLVIAWVEDNVDEPQWGTICDDIFYDFEDKGDTTEDMSNTMCKELGYEGGDFLNKDGTDSGYRVLVDNDDELRKNACNGDEERLLDCSFLSYGQSNCWHLEDVGLRCYPEGYEAPPCSYKYTAKCEQGDVVMT